MPDTYSEAGLTLTKSFEGLRLSSYQDGAGIWTIGYGHTSPHIGPGLTIDEAEATLYLRADLADAIACVNRAVHATLTQNQFDALVDFCFNVGRGAFLGSSLLRYVNQSNFAAAAQQFLLWSHINGKPSPGLLRRRKAEQALFLAESPANPS